MADTITGTILIAPRFKASLKVGGDFNKRDSGMHDSLFVNSANAIVVDDVTDVLNKAQVNDATVTALIKDSDGNTVASSSISLTFESGSGGRYKGQFPNAVSLTKGASYDVVATVTQGGRSIQITSTKVARNYGGK